MFSSNLILLTDKTPPSNTTPSSDTPSPLLHKKLTPHPYQLILPLPPPLPSSKFKGSKVTNSKSPGIYFFYNLPDHQAFDWIKKKIEKLVYLIWKRRCVRFAFNIWIQKRNKHKEFNLSTSGANCVPSIIQQKQHRLSK